MNPNAIWLAAFCFIAAPALAQDTTPGGAAPAADANSAPQAELPAPEIGADVLLIRVAGPWQTPEAKGFSRLIARAASGKLSLLVEWLGNDGKLVQSLPLEAPENAAQLPLSSVRSETGPDDSAVYFDTPEDAQGFRETYVLIVGAPGEARFGPATN